jgi:transposase-like protein
MRQEPLIELRCPHCGEVSRRSPRFVAARRMFVCNHCHEMVRIEVGVAATRDVTGGHGVVVGRSS